jgi:hypothetical protein
MSVVKERDKGVVGDRVSKTMARVKGIGKVR